MQQRLFARDYETLVEVPGLLPDVRRGQYCGVLSARQGQRIRLVRLVKVDDVERLARPVPAE
jgi:hypothetical protein